MIHAKEDNESIALNGDELEIDVVDKSKFNISKNYIISYKN
jgi:hypothetical protein